MIVSPLLDLTHSLLMNRPVGWVYFVPFGAVSSTCRSAILIARCVYGTEDDLDRGDKEKEYVSEGA